MSPKLKNALDRMNKAIADKVGLKRLLAKCIQLLEANTRQLKTVQYLLSWMHDAIHEITSNHATTPLFDAYGLVFFLKKFLLDQPKPIKQIGANIIRFVSLLYPSQIQPLLSDIHPYTQGHDEYWMCYVIEKFL